MASNLGIDLRFVLSYTYTILYVQFLGKLYKFYSEGLELLRSKCFWKTFVFAHSRFCFAPLQVLGDLEDVVHEVRKAVLTDLANVNLLAFEV